MRVKRCLAPSAVSSNAPAASRRDHWGMRDLAYPVRKQMRGYFVRLEYVAPGDTVAELERVIRISDGVFKFITVKLADTVEEVA